LPGKPFPWGREPQKEREDFKRKLANKLPRERKVPNFSPRQEMNSTREGGVVRGSLKKPLAPKKKKETFPVSRRGDPEYYGEGRFFLSKPTP